MILPLAGDRKPEPYLQTKYTEMKPAFSPDGRWVAYESNESGRYEIYVQGFPDKRGKWLISASGGRQAAWRRDGKELYWVRPDGTLMAASMKLLKAGVRAGQPQTLFRISNWDGALTAYQTDGNGRRFLVYEPEAGQRELPMVVVQNWAARLGK
ncbi:MAG: hypothetical protein FJW20_13875 [Acidimicrobiia bacterium]|nr:hypothetical protein [Acidimicrobiia bacterium]